jgi:hypothetical protein
MSDDDTSTQIDDLGKRVDKAVEMAIGRLREDFSKSSVDANEDRMRSLRREIEDMMHGLHSSDKTEREELRAELAKVNKFIEDLKGAQDTKKDNSTTIVVPASQIDQVKNESKEEPVDDRRLEDESNPPRQGFLKKWW